MDVAQTIERFIIDELMMGDSKVSLDYNESLVEKGVIDSLSLLRLISFVEEQFGVTVEDDEVLAENFESINVTTAFVQNKL